MNALSSPSTGPDGVRKPGRSGGAATHRLFDAVLLLLLIAALAFIGYTEYQHQTTVKQLNVTNQKLQDFEKNPQKSGDAIAKQVLDKLRKLMVVPDNPAPTVATIVNVDQLKQTNHFYDPAKNGDHLIIMGPQDRARAILFDADANNGAGVILDVIPVQFTPSSPAPSGAPAASGAPAPATSPAPSTTP